MPTPRVQAAAEGMPTVPNPTPEELSHIAREVECEARISNAADFARVAQYMADAMLGTRRPGADSRIELQEWEADLLIFCAGQAKFAATAVQDDLDERRIGVLPAEEAAR